MLGVPLSGAKEGMANTVCYIYQTHDRRRSGCDLKHLKWMLIVCFKCPFYDNWIFSIVQNICFIDTWGCGPCVAWHLRVLALMYQWSITTLPSFYGKMLYHFLLYITTTAILLLYLYNSFSENSSKLPSYSTWLSIVWPSWIGNSRDNPWVSRALPLP